MAFLKFIFTIKMANIIEVADMIIRIDLEKRNRLLIFKNRKWELLFDGKDVFGYEILNIYSIGNKILVFSSKGRFVSDNLSETWDKINGFKDFHYTNHNLFLDDLRSIPEGFIGVKNFNEFIIFIKLNGLTKFISFDHDLGEGKTGYDCAKFLISYCLDNNLSLPNWKVHSQNPVGKENIEKLLYNFEKQLYI